MSQYLRTLSTNIANHPLIAQQLKPYWNSRNAREQLTLKLLGVTLLLALIYYAIIMPLQNARAAAETKLYNSQQLLGWVQQNIARYQAAGGDPSSTTAIAGSLQQNVTNVARNYNLSIARIQPQNNDLIVVIDEAPFNQVLEFMQALQNTGISVKSVDIAEQGAPGQVRVRRIVVAE